MEHGPNRCKHSSNTTLRTRAATLLGMSAGLSRYGKEDGGSDHHSAAVSSMNSAMDASTTTPPRVGSTR